MYDGEAFKTANIQSKHLPELEKNQLQSHGKSKNRRPRMSSVSYLNTEDSTKLPFMTKFTNSMKNNIISPITKKLVFSSPKTNKNATDILKSGYLKQGFMKTLIEDQQTKENAWDKLFIKSNNNTNITKTSPIKIPRKSVVQSKLSNIFEKTAPPSNIIEHIEENDSIEHNKLNQNNKVIAKESKLDIRPPKSKIHLGTHIDTNHQVLSHADSLGCSESLISPNDRKQKRFSKRNLACTEVLPKLDSGKHNSQILTILEKIDKAGLSIDLMNEYKPQSLIAFSKSVDSDRIKRLDHSIAYQAEEANPQKEIKDTKDLLSAGQTKAGRLIDFPYMPRKQKKKSFFFCCA